MVRMFAALAGALAIGLPAVAQDDDAAPGRLVLDAVGEAVVAPDLASVFVGVRAEGDTAAEAMAAQRDAMTAVIAALTDAGVAERDVQTSGLSLYPTYGDSSDRNSGPRIVGYQASNQVTAVVRDIADVGATLDALVAAGANDIQGINFGVEDRESLADAARRDAIAKMQERARLYAEAADFELGRLVELRESASGGAPYPTTMARQREFAMDTTPVAGGELTVTVSVTGVYEIQR